MTVQIDEVKKKFAVASTAMDLYFVYKFAKFIAMPWESWPAYQLGIIDEKGNVIKKKRSGLEERSNYTLFHRLLRKLKQLMEKGVTAQKQQDRKTLSYVG